GPADRTRGGALRGAAARAQQQHHQGRVLDLGATLRQDFIGPDGYGWQVYTDPIGHPFCLCRNRGVIWTDQGPIWPKRD
ncbi:VOC family protein, partial [[Kitasatospora] papulosa]|uniref:VOC family protein n=1 Tax=[Kitasatospora] papulosa TaxID=1464011 RepID=UPI003682A3DD